MRITKKQPGVEESVIAHVAVSKIEADHDAKQITFIATSILTPNQYRVTIYGDEINLLMRSLKDSNRRDR